MYITTTKIYTALPRVHRVQFRPVCKALKIVGVTTIKMGMALTRNSSKKPFLLNPRYAPGVGVYVVSIQPMERKSVGRFTGLA